MADIIIAFPKLEDAKKLRRLLVRNGYEVNRICDSGAQAVEAVNCLDGGIVICGYRFSDMYCMDIYDYLPRGFQMLLLASPGKLAECSLSGAVTVAMPFKAQELFCTLEMMMAQYNRWHKRQSGRPKARSEGEKKAIARAKELLMERNQMTEEEAHRYIQKLSMDSGTGMAETAEMILELKGKQWEI